MTASAQTTTTPPAVTLAPLHTQLLVRIRPLPSQTGSILRVPRDEHARVADVLAVGPDCRDVRPGNVVLVSMLAGQAVGDSLLLPETAVLAFLDDTELAQ